MKRFSTESSNELSSHVSGNTSGQVLSTKEIIKLAREKYLQYISQTPNVLSTCFFIPLKLVNLVSLVRLLKMWSLYYFFQLLLIKLSTNSFIVRTIYLACVISHVPLNDSPVKRVVFYFAEAFQERIHQETGNLLLEGIEHNRRGPMQLQEALTRLHPSVIACQQQFPFFLKAFSSSIIAFLHFSSWIPSFHP